MGFFPIDDESVNYLRATGRSEEHCRLYESYYRAQGLFGMPEKGQVDYSSDLELDLGTVVPGVAGPKRPQDRIDLPALKQTFAGLLQKPVAEGGYGKTLEEISKRFRVRSDHHGAPAVDRSYGQNRADLSPSESEMRDQHPTPDSVERLPVDTARRIDTEIAHGSVLIAAITSCTNTSNPSVMLGAGLLAKKAVERGLKVNPVVKCSLAPGSRVVTDYLEKTGLQEYLDRLGFNLVGYGCTTCIGNSGPLNPAIEEALVREDLVAASVLSGNRNFEARVHQSIRANFLMSPPLVVAFALAGRVDIDLTREPIGQSADGEDVYLKDLWPTLEEIRKEMEAALKPGVYRRLYQDFAGQNPKWNEIPASIGTVYEWDPGSTYIQEPPFFAEFSLDPEPVRDVRNARALGIFGDSVTTDHISPAGAIKKSSPAGRYLMEQGVDFFDFNSYGSRRGNDRVMTRGTFANVRIKNLMVPGVEGGVTKLQPEGESMSLYDAAMKYEERGTPLVVIAGHEYGTGSSRDWAAKGTKLLGVRAVIAQSFERIHRSNLVGMGVLPLQFQGETGARSLRLDGTETFDIAGLEGELKPRQELKLRITRSDGTAGEVPVRCRIDTPIEIEYYRHGGILQYVLRQLLATR
jgi:aconitate hydratase